MFGAWRDTARDVAYKEVLGGASFAVDPVFLSYRTAPIRVTAVARSRQRRVQHQRRLSQAEDANRIRSSTAAGDDGARRAAAAAAEPLECHPADRRQLDHSEHDVLLCGM